MNKKGKKPKAKNSMSSISGKPVLFTTELNSKSKLGIENESKATNSQAPTNKIPYKADCNELGQKDIEMISDSESIGNFEEVEEKTDELASYMEVKGDKVDNPSIIKTRNRKNSNPTSLSPSSYLPEGDDAYKVLRAFDDFYKNPKNIENELYIYRSPRVSFELFQISTEPSDIYKQHISSIALDSNLDRKMNKKFDFDKISKEDFDYYMKFVSFYKENCSKKEAM